MILFSPLFLSVFAHSCGVSYYGFNKDQRARLEDSAQSCFFTVKFCVVLCENCCRSLRSANVMYFTEPQFYRLEGVWLTESGMSLLRSISMSPLHKRRQRRSRLGTMCVEGGPDGMELKEVEGDGEDGKGWHTDCYINSYQTCSF